MKIKPLILKLGGSVITRKDKPYTPNRYIISRLAEEISRAKPENLLVIHGGGSFGHPLAHEYNILGGYREERQRIGFAKTHQSMVNLNRLIVEALVENNIAAVSMPPSSFIIANNTRIEFFMEKPLAGLLNMGFVPVLYGDAVLDSSLGFTILSGDQIAAYLALKFKSEKIIFGVDVDGLYTADPKSAPSAKLLKEVDLKELMEAMKGFSESRFVDVTGGMWGKVKELIPAIEQGIRVVMINATNSGNVYKALVGDEMVGTLIRRG